MLKGSMKILVGNLPEPNLKTTTRPAWQKPVVEYPKDAKIKEVPFKWVPEKKKLKPTGRKAMTVAPKRMAERDISYPRKPWTQEREDKLIELYNTGMSYADISTRIQTSERAIAQHLDTMRREGRLDKRRRQCDRSGWSEEQLETMKRMREEGKPYREIAATVGKPYQTVYTVIKRMEGKK